MVEPTARSGLSFLDTAAWKTTCAWRSVASVERPEAGMVSRSG